MRLSLWLPKTRPRVASFVPVGPRNSVRFSDLLVAQYHLISCFTRGNTGLVSNRSVSVRAARPGLHTNPIGRGHRRPTFVLLPSCDSDPAIRDTPSARFGDACSGTLGSGSGGARCGWVGAWFTRRWRQVRRLRWAGGTGRSTPVALSEPVDRVLTPDSVEPAGTEPFVGCSRCIGPFGPTSRDCRRCMLVVPA